MFWNSIQKALVYTIIMVAAASVIASEVTDAELAAAKKKASAYSGKQNEEWMIAQSHLISAKGKVENQHKLVENLIAQKSILKGKAQLDKIEELKKAHSDLIALIENYNQLNSNFETKYPEKGAAFGRVYKRVDPTNLETLENQMTLEGRLKRLNTKIKKQYRQEDDVTAATKASVKKPVSEIKPDSKGPDVTDQIILQK